MALPPGRLSFVILNETESTRSWPLVSAYGCHHDMNAAKESINFLLESLPKGLTLAMITEQEWYFTAPVFYRRSSMEVNSRIAKAILRRNKNALSIFALLGGLITGTVYAQTSFTQPCASKNNSLLVDSGTPSSNEREAILDSLREDLTRMHATQNPDLDFVSLMQAYNSALNRMTQEELVHGRDAKIKLLAKKLLNAQNLHQKQVNSWIARFHRYD